MCKLCFVKSHLSLHGGIPIDRGSNGPIIKKGPLDRGSDRWIIEKGPLDQGSIDRFYLVYRALFQGKGHIDRGFDRPILARSIRPVYIVNEKGP